MTFSPKESLTNDGGRSLEESSLTSIIPFLHEMHDSAAANRIIESHKWVMVKCEPHGTNALLCRMRCSVCSLGKIMTLYDIGLCVVFG